MIKRGGGVERRQARTGSRRHPANHTAPPSATARRFNNAGPAQQCDDGTLRCQSLQDFAWDLALITLKRWVFALAGQQARCGCQLGGQGAGTVGGQAAGAATLTPHPCVWRALSRALRTA